MEGRSWAEQTRGANEEIAVRYTHTQREKERERDER